MVINDVRGVMDIIRESNIYEIVIVSLVILPLILLSWLSVLEKINIASNAISIGIIMGSYIIGIIVIKYSQSEEQKLESKKISLIRYLEHTESKVRKYTTVRNRLGNLYTNSFIENLIDKYPNELRRAKLQGGGVGLVEDREV